MRLAETAVFGQLHRLPLRQWVGVLIVAIVCAVCPSAQISAQGSAHVHFRLQPRGTLESHLKSFSTRNGEREALIRKWFAEAGCMDANLSEQALRILPPNVICVLPGETQEVIVVGAHTDKVERAGDGVVDNWTGATLLPSLLYSLSGQPRHHTLIFIGFSGEEKGLVGSRYYVDHLTKEQRARIGAMVNFDSLGMGPTEVWASHADRILLNGLELVAAASKLPMTIMNVPNGASADSESFAPYHIPRITLHSVTTDTWSVLHSRFDNMAAIKMNDYYDSYKLIAEYLAYLDELLKPAPTKPETAAQ
jgi:Peptidase family M28